MAQLPRFDDPPLVETVLSVEFRPLSGWDVPYFGLFWEFVRADFPEVETHLAVESEREQGEPALQFVNRPPLRCWYIHQDKSRLIQIQRNRFMHNWRKEGAKYPHYDTVIRPSFEVEWKRYQDFVRTHALGELGLVRCEVTYINHIEQGKGWNSFADLSRVLKFWSNEPTSLPLPLDRASFQISLALPENRGRLQVLVKPAIRSDDGKKLLSLELTARGTPRTESPESCLEWLDFGREWVVRAFADMTTSQMHTIWKRTQ